MKSRLLTLGLAISSCAAIAQHKSAYNYNKSAFSGFQNVQTRSASNAESALKQVSNQFAGWTGSTDKLTNAWRNIYGPAVSVPGNTLTDRAGYLMDGKLAALGINKSEWTLLRAKEEPHAGYVTYQQVLNGKVVLFSSLQLKFTVDGKLVQVSRHAYGTAGTNIIPQLSQSNAATAAISDITTASFNSITPEGDWNWMPIPAANGYELRPAWQVLAKGVREDRLPATLRVVVDAVNGEILYRNNEVKETVDRTVKGKVFKENPQVPATKEPLVNLEVDLGSAFQYTDGNGFYSEPGLTAPVSATMRLQGMWSKVIDADLGFVTPEYTDMITASGDTLLYPIAAPYGDRHVNAYYHTTRVHDFMKGYLPSFTGMDIPLTTNVDVTSSWVTNCNAFYSGSTINFLKEDGACNSFAICGDIVYHEYGHGITDIYYQQNGGSGMINGAMNEANSDVWGLSITKDPVLGKGSFKGGGIIRRYDQGPKVYPFDIEGEVHADGEILAGAWWDVAVNTGSVETMTDLFSKTYADLANGPDGTEGEVYYDILISALTNDDDDGDITNGTPNFAAIVRAFGRHGIYYLNDLTLVHKDIPNPPAGAPIVISAEITTINTAMLGDILLLYKQRPTNVYDTVAMTTTGGNIYTATIPAQTGGMIMDYHFVITDTLYSMVVKYPLGFRMGSGINSTESNIPYQFGVGLKSKITEDFETASSTWQIGNVGGDNATKGVWIQAAPIGSYLTSAQGSLPVQTNHDHTFSDGSGQCLVTGNAGSTSANVGAQDVDDGKTTVLSAEYNLSEMVTPVIEYFRWYSNDKGEDPNVNYWQVQIKNANGWINVDRTNQSDASWRRKIFAVKSLVQNTTAVQLRFIAADNSTDGALVEAAVDDFIIYEGDAATSVKNVQQELANIYPNPADEQVQIIMPNGSTGAIKLYDLTGKFLSVTEIKQGKTHYSIGTVTLPNGSYMLSIEANGKIQGKQVVVKH